mgnify:CR=1 FL=1
MSLSMVHNDRTSGYIYKGIAILLVSLLFPCCLVSQEPSGDRPPEIEEIPWDFEGMLKAPACRWLQDTARVRALLYEGEPYHGNKTEIFAFYASPATLDTALARQSFPAVVLVHGGGGQAFSWWVEMWAERGYAAIAMDLRGNRPGSKQGGESVVKLENGGPVHTRETSFWAVDSTFQVQWQFHAVSAVIRAHSLIRSIPEVDETRTALTGVSWGGYLTHIVRGLDHRFSAAVSVYGCGFIQEGSYWTMKPIFNAMTESQVQRWITFWDPAIYVPYGTSPLLMINGTNDRYYYLDIFSKTARLAKNGSVLIRKDLGHGHQPGARQPEIMAFIDHYLRNTKPLPEITRTRQRQSKVVARYRSAEPLAEAHIFYTRDSSGNEHRVWKGNPLYVRKGYVKGSIPADATAWYVSLTDQRGLSISSPAIFRNK